MEVTLNYWAIIVAAFAGMAVGMLWYGPVFGRQWMKLMKFTPQSMKGMKLTPMQAMGLGLVTTLVMSFVLAHFVDYVAAASFGAAFQLAFWVWLGFMMPLNAGVFLWEGKPFKLFVLNTAYHLVSLIVMAAILALWA